MDLNKEQIDKLWNKDAYYQLIDECQKGGGDEAKLFIPRIYQVIAASGATRVLDVGCGEGSVIQDLVALSSSNVQYQGIDVAPIGVERALKRGIGTAQFSVYDGSVIPFADGSFDCSISTFVFEHITTPEAVFAEMVRVTKVGGHIIIACPNYGSPFFRSPCNTHNKLALLVRRLVEACLPAKKFRTSFRWQAVVPLELKSDEHIMDYDTTVEPSLHSFRHYISQHAALTVVDSSSVWESFSYQGTSVLKKWFLTVVATLGKKKFLAFGDFGPFFFCVVRKNQ